MIFSPHHWGSLSPCSTLLAPSCVEQSGHFDSSWLSLAHGTGDEWWYSLDGCFQMFLCFFCPKPWEDDPIWLGRIFFQIFVGEKNPPSLVMSSWYLDPSFNDWIPFGPPESEVFPGWRCFFHHGFGWRIPTRTKTHTFGWRMPSFFRILGLDLGDSDPNEKQCKEKEMPVERS